MIAQRLVLILAAALTVAGCGSDSSSSPDRSIIPSTSASGSGEQAISTSVARARLDELAAAWQAQQQPGQDPRERLESCPLLDVTSFAAVAPASVGDTAGWVAGGGIDKDGLGVVCQVGGDDVAVIVAVEDAPTGAFADHVVNDILGGNTDDQVTLDGTTEFAGGVLNPFTYVEDGAPSRAVSWINADLEVVLVIPSETASTADATSWLTAVLADVIRRVEQLTLAVLPAPSES